MNASTPQVATPRSIMHYVRHLPRFQRFLGILYIVALFASIGVLIGCVIFTEPAPSTVVEPHEADTISTVIDWYYTPNETFAVTPLYE